MVERLSLMAVLIFLDQIGQRKFYRIALFFFGIQRVVLKRQADKVVFIIGKRPFPGNQNLKRISTIFVRFTVLFFDPFKKILIKGFTRIFVLQFNPDDMTRRDTASVSN